MYLSIAKFISREFKASSYYNIINLNAFAFDFTGIIYNHCISWYIFLILVFNVSITDY